MKKMTKKLGAVVLALALCVSLCAAALAAAGDGYEITVVNATAGQDYSAYKIFDATYDSNTGGVSYTIDQSSAWYPAVTGLTTDGNVSVFELTEIAGTDRYYVTVTDGVSDAEVIAALLTVEIPAGAQAAAALTAEGESLTLDVGEPGYYFVTTTNGSAVSITTAAPAATIIDKNTPPGVEKTVETGLDTSDDLHGDTEAIGDDVVFKVTGSVPLYTTGDDDISGGYLVTDYVFTDHMSDGLQIRGLEEGVHYTVETVRDDATGTETTRYIATEALVDSWVKLDGGSIYGQAYNVVLELTDPGAYTDESGSTATQFGGFILTYDTIDCKDELDGTQYGKASDIETTYPVNPTVEIVYTAQMTGEAAEYDNTNDIDMIWHVTTFLTPDEPVYGGGSHDDNDIYVLALTLLKVDGTDGITPLKGAEFRLEGTNLNQVVTNTSETYTELDRDGYLAALAAGTELWFELKSGGYTNVSPYDLDPVEDSEELDRYVYDDQPGVPEDYHYVASTRTITYSTTTQAAENQTVTGITDENGVLSFDGLTEGTWTLTEITAPDGYNLLHDSIELTVKVADWTTDPATGKTVPVWEITGADVDGNGVISLTVSNFTGTELPGTGGIGTTIFYILGGVLVAGAVVVLVTRRRMSRGN